MSKQITIDPSKQASYKQVKFLAIKFSGEGFTYTDTVNWKNVNVAVALILGHHTAIDSPLTMGEVQGILDKKQLPKVYLDRFVAKAKPVAKAKAKKAVLIAPPADDFETELAALGIRL